MAREGDIPAGARVRWRMFPSFLPRARGATATAIQFSRRRENWIAVAVAPRARGRNEGNILHRTRAPAGMSPSRAMAPTSGEALALAGLGRMRCYELFALQS